MKQKKILSESRLLMFIGRKRGFKFTLTNYKSRKIHWQFWGTFLILFSGDFCIFPLRLPLYSHNI